MRLYLSTIRFKHRLPPIRCDHPTRWSKCSQIGLYALIWACLGAFIACLCSLFAHVRIIAPFPVLQNLAKELDIDNRRRIKTIS